MLDAHFRWDPVIRQTRALWVLTRTCTSSVSPLACQGSPSSSGPNVDSTDGFLHHRVGKREDTGPVCMRNTQKRAWALPPSSFTFAVKAQVLYCSSWRRTSALTMPEGLWLPPHPLPISTVLCGAWTDHEENHNTASHLWKISNCILVYWLQSSSIMPQIIKYCHRDIKNTDQFTKITVFWRLCTYYTFYSIM